MTELGPAGALQQEGASELSPEAKEEQKKENHHKEWCGNETSLTTKKRDDHAAIVETLTAELTNLAEVVTEKNNDLAKNAQAIADEEAAWEAMRAWLRAWRADPARPSRALALAETRVAGDLGEATEADWEVSSEGDEMPALVEDDAEEAGDGGKGPQPSPPSPALHGCAMLLCI